MSQADQDLQDDLSLISRITVVPSLLDVVCRTTGMGFAAIARVTPEKWVACAVKDEISFGLRPGGELKLETTICNEIRQNHQHVVIDHVSEDKNFNAHHTPAMYGFQSYISIPILRRNGSFFGTLCAIDPRPAQLNNPETIGMFYLFADLIAFHMSALEDLDNATTALSDEKKLAELREQFIAILAHDLRNPLNAIMLSSELILQSSKEQLATLSARKIRQSSHRILDLIENMLDFARGRLGEGIVLNRKNVMDLEAVIGQVIQELQPLWPDRKVETNFHLSGAVYCDPQRMGQVVSNLLGNAMIHGKPNTAITVSLDHSSEAFNLTVTNKVENIADADLEGLFKPFYRGQDKSGKKGLGLGLYIASEIATAHGGNLEADLKEDEISFLFRM